MSDYQKLKELYQQTCVELKETRKLFKMARKGEEIAIYKLEDTERKLKNVRKELDEYKLLLSVKLDNINNIKKQYRK